MGGKALLKNLISATGLPEEAVALELTRLLSEAGIAENELTLDELRELLAEYMQDVLVLANNEYSV